MTTENTPEEKAKFFAQYYPQKILHHKDYEDFCPVGFGSILSMDYYARNNYYLLLTPLKNISDEDAIEVAKIVFDYYKSEKEIVFTNNAVLKINRINKDIDIWFLDLLVNIHTVSGTTSFCLDDKHFLAVPVFVYDFLRSKSYLLPYKDLSTEDLIAYGWAKEIKS